jgi:hypothetical protein
MEKSRPTALIRSGIVLVIAHDAGGAEILSSLLKSCKIKYKLSLAGPAIPIFERKLGNFENFSLDEGIKFSDWVLTGTGWASDFEYKGIRKAKDFGKFVASFLDHWVNYKDRFVRNGVFVLPDEIWVGDPHAFNMALEVFPKISVKFKENPIYKEVKKNYSEAKINQINESTKQILFLSDNIEESLLKQHGDNNYWGYTDKDSFEYMMKNLYKVSTKIDKITIRLHPSEFPENFDWAIKKYGPLVEKNSSIPLIQELANHEIVIGSESMAMVFALLCGKRVICSIPHSGKRFSLPYREIEMLRNI